MKGPVIDMMGGGLGKMRHISLKFLHTGIQYILRTLPTECSQMILLLVQKEGNDPSLASQQKNSLPSLEI